MGKNREIILCYHRISKKKLKEHLNFIEDCFQITSIDNVIKKKYNLNNVIKIVFTMDDLYRNSYRSWVEVLCKKNIHSTIFVPTWYSLNNDTLWSMKLIKISDKIAFTFVDLNKRKIRFKNVSDKKYFFNNLISKFQNSEIQTNELEILCDKLLKFNHVKLNDEDLVVNLKELKKDYNRYRHLNIQSHTHRHNKMAFQNANEIKDDIVKSLNILESYGLNKNNKKIICYPYGSDKLIGKSFHYLKSYFDAGVVLGISKLSDDEDLLIPRLGIYETDSIFRLWIKIFLFSWKK